jgi:hypothetical protein
VNLLTNVPGREDVEAEAVSRDIHLDAAGTVLRGHVGDRALERGEEVGEKGGGGLDQGVRGIAGLDDYVSGEARRNRSDRSRTSDGEDHFRCGRRCSALREQPLRIGREPRRQAPADRCGNLRLARVLRMVDAQPRAHAVVGEPLRFVTREGNAQVLYRRDPLLLELLRVEPGGGRVFVRPVAENQRNVLVDADQAVECRADPGEIGNLDEERRRELTPSGDQLVVDVELDLDLLGFADSLDPRSSKRSVT